MPRHTDPAEPVQKKEKNKNSGLKTKIVSVEDLLFKHPLKIPHYQRPYKWSKRNVNLLIDDILQHSEKSAYRIGTIVIHAHDKEFDIVDGQQRIITLAMIAAELLKLDAGDHPIRRNTADICLAATEFVNPVTRKNLERNFRLIKGRIKEFTKNDLIFFFKKCQCVYVQLSDVSTAFQFFDSQNTRGKDLAPHDLLKAFHLREMSGNTESERIACVEEWEKVSDSLHNILGSYLYRVRRWTKGYSALNFTKDDIAAFKGISLNTEGRYNFETPYRQNHSYTMMTAENGQTSPYPFQIDQIMINGKLFFEYVRHYSGYIQEMENAYHHKPEIRNRSILRLLRNEDSEATRIMRLLRLYKGRGRKGDSYIRNVFDCALIYYLDKFGPEKLGRLVVRTFLWAYTLRLENQAVQAVTAQNLAIGKNSFFRVIREAVDPSEVLNINIRPAEFKAKKVKDIKGIVVFFKNLRSIKA